MSTHIDKVLVPTRVKSIKHPIVDIAMGPTHTVALTNLGKVIAFGRNSEAQLGRGHARSVQGPEFVKALQDKEIGLVSCGATFTVVGTVENVIYFWGTRFISPVARPDTRNAFGDSFGARLATPMDLLLTEAEVRAMVQREKDSGPNGTGRNVSTGLMAHDRMMMVPMQHDDRSVATISTAELIKHQGEITMKDVVLEPQEILALYASQSQLEKGGTVMLSKIESQNQNIFLIVETTCPLSKTDRPGTGSTSAGVKPPPLSIDIGVHDNDSEEEHGYEEGRDYHDQSVPPDWIQNELNDADAMDGVGARPPTRGGNKRPQPQQQQLLKPRQQPHDKQEYEKKLDDQYRSLQIELRLQAENAVKEREKTLNEEIVRLRQELDRNRQEKRDLISTRGGAEGGGGILDKGRQRRASSSTCSIQ